MKNIQTNPAIKTRRYQFVCLLTTCFYLYFPLCYAESLLHTSPRFDRYDSADGLSQMAVNSIAQDRHGYLWIATQEGLNRFDGHEFRIFKNHVDKNSLSANWVNHIY